MGPLPILSVIHIVTINTMLNFNGVNNRNGLKNVKCKQIFSINQFDIMDSKMAEPMIAFINTKNKCTLIAFEVNTWSKSSSPKCINICLTV